MNDFIVKGHYGIIYKIVNKINGKTYVGQTTQDIKTRFYQHTKNKKSAVSLAINKYGKDNFIISEIDKCEFKELNKKEREWIATLGTMVPNGYNVADPGCKEQLVRKTRIKNSIKKRISNENYYIKIDPKLLSSLKPHLLSTLLNLAKFKKYDDDISISVGEMNDETSTRQTRRHLKELEKEGYIKCEFGMPGTPNKYIITTNLLKFNFRREISLSKKVMSSPGFTKLSQSAALTILAISESSNEQGQCELSLAQILEMIPVAESSIRRSFRELVGSGMLSILERPAQTNLYKILV